LVPGERHPNCAKHSKWSERYSWGENNRPVVYEGDGCLRAD
jgi:hypothetical protein